MIFQACFIGVIRQFFSLPLGMAMSDRMMIAIVWRKEPLNIKWTSIKMQSTFWISSKKVNFAQVVEMMVLSSFSITTNIDKRVS
jgi:hypothetical protein